MAFVPSAGKWAILEDGENLLTVQSRALLAELYEQLKWLDGRIDSFDRRLAEVAKSHQSCQKVLELPGIGIITATVLVAAVGSAHEFKNGRELAAWLGLVPRQHSSGGKTVLLGISKRGNGTLRTLFIHGARAVLWHYRKVEPAQASARIRWVQDLIARHGVNRAIVALANKMARQAWMLLAKGVAYVPAS